MVYTHRTRWGRVYEITGGFGIHCSLSTVVGNYDIGRVTFPTSADLDYGDVIGAYIDLVIPSFTNTFANANWMLADAGYPVMTFLRIGHAGTADCISDLTSCCYSRVAGTYPYTRIYGDTNFAVVFKSTGYYGHELEIDLRNIRSQGNNLIIENCYFIQRFYVR